MASLLSVTATALLLWLGSSLELAYGQLREGTVEENHPEGMPANLESGWNMMQLGCIQTFDPSFEWYTQVPHTCTWNMALFAGMSFMGGNPVNTAANWADCLAASADAETCNETLTRDGLECSYCDFMAANPSLDSSYVEQFGPGSCLLAGITSTSCREQEGISLWHMMQETYRDSIPFPLEQAECLIHSTDEAACLATTDSKGNPCGFCAMTSNLNYRLHPANTVCFQKHLLEDEHWCEHLNSNWRTLGPTTTSTTTTTVMTETTTSGSSDSLMRHASSFVVVAAASLLATLYGTVMF